MKRYSRDGRAPVPRREVVSKVMSANRSRDTGPELVLRRALSERKIRGYRLHRKGVPGKPDISFGPEKVAVFTNGCFWHRCPKCKLPLPDSNMAFWKQKFLRNKKRDMLNVKRLQTLGWRVFVFWECEIEKDPRRLAGMILTLL